MWSWIAKKIVPYIPKERQWDIHTIYKHEWYVEGWHDRRGWASGTFPTFDEADKFYHKKIRAGYKVTPPVKHYYSIRSFVRKNGERQPSFY